MHFDYLDESHTMVKSNLYFVKLIQTVQDGLDKPIKPICLDWLQSSISVNFGCQHGGCLVPQKYACRSKYEGVLGIINKKTQNIVLLLTFLHKFYMIFPGSSSLGSPCTGIINHYIRDRMLDTSGRGINVLV